VFNQMEALEDEQVIRISGTDPEALVRCHLPSSIFHLPSSGLPFRPLRALIVSVGLALLGRDWR